MSRRRSNRLRRKVRRTVALYLFLKGLTYHQIAAKLEVSHMTVRRDILLALGDYCDRDSPETN